MKTFDPRLIRSMKRYVELFFPSLSYPLKKETHDHIINTYFVNGDLKKVRRNYYFYVDRDDNPIIRENGLTNAYNPSSRFRVISELEPMYYMFGEEEFEEYFRQVHNIDINDGGPFDENWFFDDLD
jgi:hypothetical protein